MTKKLTKEEAAVLLNTLEILNRFDEAFDCEVCGIFSSQCHGFEKYLCYDLQKQVLIKIINSGTVH